MQKATGKVREQEKIESVVIQLLLLLQMKQIITANRYSCCCYNPPLHSVHGHPEHRRNPSWTESPKTRKPCKVNNTRELNIPLQNLAETHLLHLSAFGFTESSRPKRLFGFLPLHVCSLH
ncbi:hypothetical protein mRhiFer1_008259 [Rhinolophus ferrumequinum]|uniref:Uncharacterized protein n=1 Tax=Rhinolophus ferrumequinum TaxID=59479 RepID=A0A7J7VQU4_RHIFE|nr:hypothetical protein mRhiFer1_008259 [Rhinolophus ferrumequinum]